MGRILTVTLALFVTAALGQEAEFYSYNGLSQSSYNLCPYSVKRNVSKTVSYVKSFTTHESCGGSQPWKVCPKQTFKTLYRTTVVETTETRTGCCQGFEQQGHYCVLPPNATKEFASRPGTCPTKQNTTGNHTCRWDTDCPGLQKCCDINGESLCVSPIPAVNEGYFNLLIEVKQDFEQAEWDLMNHLRFLHSVVTGALHSMNCSIYHLHTQPDGGSKILSKLLLGTRPPATLGNVSKELQKVLINIDEICHLETKDINECEHKELNSCSLRATCSNTDGSHHCKCQSGFTDRDPSGQGRDCREVTTAVLIPESMSSTAAPIVMELGRSTPNMPSTESPSCSPDPVTNLTIINVTGISFTVIWARDTSKNQTVTVRVLREDSMVIETETQEMNWTVSGLEPAVLYTVEIYWQSCGNSFTKEIKVKTAALLLNGQVRIQNQDFSEALSNTSSGQFRTFLQLWNQEIERSLPSTIRQWYKSRKILARVKSLSNGSIVVNFEIVIDPGIQLNIWNASSALISSLYNSSVFEFNHNNTSISDINECTSPIYHDCSPHAICENNVGSYTCVCSASYRDVHPAWPGRFCEESTTTVLTPTSAEEQSSTVFPSAMVTYVNGLEFPASFSYSETPHCGPYPAVNLTISNVTSRGFQGAWSTDTAKQQIYIVQVLKGKSIVNETETQEMEWSPSGLEPSTEYVISIVSRSCGQDSTPNELKVITAPSPVSNLTVSEVTGTSFLVTWATEVSHGQTFIVQLLRNDSVVSKAETSEMEWSVSGLEPETEYTVSVVCRAHEEDSTATKLRVKTGTIVNEPASIESSIRSSIGVISTVAVYLNSSTFSPGFPYSDVPPCYPTPVINLTVSNVTTGSFHLTWTTDTYEDQTFHIQVLKNESIIKKVETMELEWTVLGLEPETEYTVNVTSQACEEESATTEVTVKTEALLDALSYTPSSQQTSTAVVSTMTIYPNTSGFPLGFAYAEDPPCSTPSPIINLTVFNITTKSFHITWTTDNYEEQLFIVQLLKDDSVVKEIETLELGLTISELEPGTEYTVSIASRSCEQDGIASELNVKTETTNVRSKRSSVDFASSMTVYLNRPGFAVDFPYPDMPLCSPSAVTNLAVSSITSGGFQVTWTTDASEEQTYVVQVWKGNIIVRETETQELEWTASGLEPGTEYIVTVVSRVCEQESITAEMNVRTALSPTKTVTGMSLSDDLDIYMSSSVQTFTSPSTQRPTTCVPSLIKSVIVLNVTSNSLKVIWEADAAIDQEFLVQLWKDEQLVVEAKTKEQSWTVSDLEAGMLYTVRVVSWLCGTEGKAKVQEVKTGKVVSRISDERISNTVASLFTTLSYRLHGDDIADMRLQMLEPAVTNDLLEGLNGLSSISGRKGTVDLSAAHVLEGRAKIINLLFDEGLRNSSSDQFKAFTEQFIAQILKSLPKYTANLLTSEKLKIVIKSLREGSVNVEFQVVLDEELAANISKIVSELVASLEDDTDFIFDPDSTGISDYNECASLEDNDCSFNAKCINTEGSYTCSCSDGFVDVNPAHPGRICGEPMVASPVTTVAAAESIMVNCNLHEISVIMERSFLEARNIPVSSLYLGNTHCNGSFGNLTHVSLKVGWTECGTQISNNDTHTVVKTTLQNIVSSSTVSAGDTLEVPVNCIFDNSLLLPDGYAPNGRNIMSLEGTKNYTASIETFNGNQTLLENPLLDPDDEVSIQVSIDTSDNRSKLVLAECWATLSNNATSDSLHGIIKNGCPVPGSQIKMSENGNSTSANFTLKVFSFISVPFVYIHCHTHVCLEANGSICQPSCSGSHVIKDAEVVAKRTLSLGPLYRRYSYEGRPVVELDENIMALKAVVGLGILLCLTLVVISAVLMTVYTRWGRSLSAQITGPDYQPFDNY